MSASRQRVLCVLKFQLYCLLLGGSLFLLAGCGDSTSETVPEVVQKKAVAVPATPTVNVPQAHQEMTDDEQIQQLFVALQTANLDENIEEFMAYYAESFPAREQKRQKTLQTWQQYDFGSLDFFIFDLKIEREVAEASVGWEIALLEAGSTAPRLIETTNQVGLSKSAQGWQITFLK